MNAYGYIRVSTDKQDLNRQKNLIRKHCQRNNYNLIGTIGQKVSGSKEDTESIERLKSLSKNDCDIIIVTEISRLSRSDRLAYTITLLSGIIEEKQIKVVFTDDPEKIYDTILNPDELKYILSEAEGAAKERKKITYRMVTGMDDKYDEDPNAFRGSVVPLGFKVIDNDKYDENDKSSKYSKKLLVPDEAKIHIIEDIFNSVINGVTLHDIAKKLNESGYISNKGKKFRDSAIGYIIKNKMYNGKMKRRDEIYDLPFKIIDDDLFKTANIKLTENQLIKTKGKKNFNQLKGILTCACGKNMMMIRNIDYYVYTCVTKANKIRHEVKCSNQGIDADLLNEIVWNVVTLSLDENKYRENNDIQIKDKEKDIKRNDSRIEELKEEIFDLKSQNKKLTDRIEEFITKDNTPISLINSLTEKYQNRENEISEKEKTLNTLQNQNIKIKSEIDKILNSGKDQFFKEIRISERARLFRQYLKSVAYYNVTQYKGFIHIIFENGYERIIAVKKYPRPYYSLLPDSFKFNTQSRTIIYSHLDHKPKYGEGFYLSFKKSELTYEGVEKQFRELETDWKLNITLPERPQIMKVRKENEAKRKQKMRSQLKTN
ncbi:site-specific DNA recombinase [Porphyromonadaceae bacterium KH3CP3RA]|nr:site-specific DNA recombinase [Porphyromonadaceae bacterium KH3CP3RA]